MTEIVDRLAEKIAAKRVVGGDFRHGEIGLGKRRSSRVHADEDLCHGFDVEVFSKFDNPYMIVDDLTQSFQGAKECVLIHAAIGSGVSLSELKELGLWREQLRHIGNPGRILLDSRVRDFKFLVQRMKCDSDANRFVV